MAELNLSHSNIADYTETSKNGESFIVLGEPLPAHKRRAGLARRNRRRKIRRETRAARPEVWGTLGFDNVKDLHWSGTLRFSAAGNERSEPETSMPVTCEQIAHIRALHPEACEKGLRVRERYISFTDVAFENLPAKTDEAGLPRLRLTLMLGPDEGAVVYYQLYPDQKSIASEKARNEVDLEYLQPEQTAGHRCDERDRLTYRIPLLTDHPLEETDDDTLVQRASRTLHERFVIKILTFKRQNAESASILRRLHYHIWGHTHELLAWSPRAGAFSVVDGSALRADVRTLFLIHGTASSTDTAFAGLLEGGSHSWLAALHASNGGPYGQIIGFNHPTFSEDAETNLAAFQDRLPRSFEFRGGMDLITHSRGGLFGKYLTLHMSAAHVQRAALVACANGVGYFTAGRRIARLLSILRAGTVAVPALRWILALAQHSGEFLMDQPGAQLMTPGSDRLKAVLANPIARPLPVQLPVVGNFDRSLVGEERFFRRWAERGLDAVIKTILGRQHDWVVGTREQFIVAPALYPAGWDAEGLTPARIHPCRHSGFFVDGPGGATNPARGRIARFLKTGKAW